MQLVVPSWFKQRQAKAEPTGPDLYRLTAPNMAESVITIRKADNGQWQAVLLKTAEGPEIAATPAEFADPIDAWGAAFELHRVHIMV
jgi:hypothetical protein